MTNKTVTFSELNLRPELLQALTRLGYESPTPIQAQSIPAALEGRDVLGLAQTGTGKTAAFVLPMLQRLSENPMPTKPHCPRALILAPTRELALQIAASIRDYGSFLRHRFSVIVGGVSQQRQVEDLRRGVDIVIATPGRLIDLMEQGFARMSSIELLVMDEADRMLEIGFMPSIRRIVAAIPKDHQTLFFSATMPPAVLGLARDMLVQPVRVEVSPESTPVDRITQSVIMANGHEKRQILVDLLDNEALNRVIVFTRTKHGADKVAKLLGQAGISAGVMHGRKSQAQRQAVLRAFTQGKIRTLVATDIAARGIDVDDVSHVINYELPNEPENYVHRIGRTARAGKSGIAIALCDGSEKAYLRQIERQMRQAVPVTARPPMCAFRVPAPTPLTEAEKMERDNSRGGYAGRGGRGVDRNGSSGRPANGNRGGYAGGGRSEGGQRSEGQRSEGGYRGPSNNNGGNGGGRSEGGYRGAGAGAGRPAGQPRRAGGGGNRR